VHRDFRLTEPQEVNKYFLWQKEKFPESAAVLMHKKCPSISIE
jgi:hypothetical protein